jgi:hypothetical protein
VNNPWCGLGCVIGFSGYLLSALSSIATAKKGESCAAAIQQAQPYPLCVHFSTLHHPLLLSLNGSMPNSTMKEIRSS